MIIDQAKTISEEEILKSDREIFFDYRFDKIEGTTIIKLRDLSKTEKYKDHFLPHDKEYPNMLNIFLDTVSRARFHRNLHKVAEFLKKYHFSFKKNKLVYEFFRLHSNRGYTSPNLMGQTYGEYDHAYDLNVLKRIEHYAHEEGYITGITMDFCEANEVDRKSKKKIG